MIGTNNLDHDSRYREVLLGGYYQVEHVRYTS